MGSQHPDGYRWTEARRARIDNNASHSAAGLSARITEDACLKGELRNSEDDECFRVSPVYKGPTT